MNFSSLVVGRDNSHVRVADNNGTFLQAGDRARVLKGVKMRFGDVSRERGQVGRLGIGLVGDDEVRKMEKWRIYE